MASFKGDGGKLDASESLDLTRHLADLSRAGVPLGKGLAALALELPRGPLAQSIDHLAQALEGGKTVEQAVADAGNQFPPHLRGLAIAGARTGKLGDLLSRLSGYVGVNDEIRRTLRSRLLYPVLLMLATFAIFCFICVALVSQFDAIYRDFNIPLPVITQLMVGVAAIVSRAGVPALILALAALATWQVSRMSLSEKMRRALSTRIPIAGPMWRMTSLAEYCHILALLVESKMPLPEALPLAGEGARDLDLEQASRSMASLVAGGAPLAQAMARQPLFPPGLPRLIDWADRHLSLPEVLHIAASMFEARARAQSVILASFVTAVCVIMILTQVLIIPALFVPLITLISRLSG
jgi:general secretion pathway protein F